MFDYASRAYISPRTFMQNGSRRMRCDSVSARTSALRQPRKEGHTAASAARCRLARLQRGRCARCASSLYACGAYARVCSLPRRVPLVPRCAEVRVAHAPRRSADYAKMMLHAVMVQRHACAVMLRVHYARVERDYAPPPMRARTTRAAIVLSLLLLRFARAQHVRVRRRDAAAARRVTPAFYDHY